MSTETNTMESDTDVFVNGIRPKERLEIEIYGTSANIFSVGRTGSTEIYVDISTLRDMATRVIEITDKMAA